VPIIASAPSPKTFATKWSKEFARAVRSEATGGRLTTVQAARIGESDPSLAPYRDNAVNYLKAHHQKTVSVDKLIGSGYRHALSEGTRVAGSNGKISLVEARRMAADLRDDFRILRGKSATPAPQGLADRIAASVSGAIYPSDDGARSNIRPVVLSAPVEGAITPEKLRTAIGAEWSALTENIWGDAPLSVNWPVLANLDSLVMEQQPQAFVDELRAQLSDFNVTEVETNIVALLDQEVTGLTAIRVGEPGANGLLDSGGDTAMLLVGKTPDDRIAGVVFGIYVDG
jgi:hypothetical protein